LCSLCSVCHSCKKTEGVFEHITLPRSSIAPIAPKDPDGGADESVQVQETQKLDVFLCSLCKSCKGAWDKKMYCPICVGAYSKDGTDPIVCCEKCERYVNLDSIPDPIL
jgi:hypothetical protein